MSKLGGMATVTVSRFPRSVTRSSRFNILYHSPFNGYDVPLNQLSRGDGPLSQLQAKDCRAQCNTRRKRHGLVNRWVLFSKSFWAPANKHVSLHTNLELLTQCFADSMGLDALVGNKPSSIRLVQPATPPSRSGTAYAYVTVT